jgi:hypothetical protein
MDSATKLARVTHLRDRALDLLKAKGAWHTVGHGERLLGLDLGDLSMLYRTPFQPLPEASENVRYMQAMLGGKGNLPYGLDIWHGRKKVMLVEWNEGEFQVVTYRPGEWEFLILGPSTAENGEDSA